MKVQQIIKYENGKERCQKCGDRIMYDGSGSINLPVYIGNLRKFRKEGFGIVKMKYDGYWGCCLNCLTKTFSWYKKEMVIEKIKI